MPRNESGEGSDGTSDEPQEARDDDSPAKRPSAHQDRQIDLKCPIAIPFSL